MWTFCQRWIAVALLAIVVSMAVGQAAPASTAPSVRVFSCQIVSGPFMPLTDDVGVAVRFENDGDQALREIVWRVPYQDQAIDVFDDGTFSPGIRIDNYALAEQGSMHVNIAAVGLNMVIAAVTLVPNMTRELKSTLALPTYISTPDPGNCAIVRVTFADGSTWTNPSLDQSLHILATPPPPTPSPLIAHSGPVAISHCMLTIGRKTALRIGFQNERTTTITRAVFRAAYANGSVDFTDAGTFRTGANLNHVLKATAAEAPQEQLYNSLDDARACTAVSVTYDDNSTWQNPDITADAGPAPTAVPDALPLSRVRVMWARRHGYPTPVPAATASI